GSAIISLTSVKESWENYKDMRNSIVLIFFIVLRSTHSIGQIIPPGMGKTHSASWLAFGVEQELDTIEDGGWKSVTYLGLGRMSNSGSHNPVHLPGIFVVNQEFYNRFHRH